MFILDPPYVSDFLLSTIRELSLPVLRNETAASLLEGSPCLAAPSAFAEHLRQGGKQRRLYCNSENSYQWIVDNLEFSPIPEWIGLFKDKLAFRRLLEPLYPDFVYHPVTLSDLAQFDVSRLSLPVVIKPAVGFFSVGVHIVRSPAEWFRTINTLRQELALAGDRFPRQVLDGRQLIIEQCIAGDEFAVDAYFDDHGQAQLVNIMGHLFASQNDVNDRIYYSSASLVRRWRKPCCDLLQRIGDLASLTNFPVHLELRIDSADRLMPIELNPQRFGGWCASDIAHHAFGVNPYRCFLEGNIPQWDSIVRERDGRSCAMVVADLPKTLDRQCIRAVDYERFAAQFSHLLELRRIDYKKHPVFAFAFAELRGDSLEELQPLLQADLSEFVTLG